MKKILNITPLAIIMVIISITLAPLSAHGGGIGYHCLKMAKSFAMFCTGALVSEFLRNRLSRKHLITIGIIAGICIIQYFIIEILFIYLEGEAYLWRTPAMIGKFVYFLAFFCLGLIMNTSCNRTSVDTSNADVIIYPFRQNIVNRTGLKNNGRLLKDCISAVICLGLYLTMKRLPENIQFYYSTSEGLRLALRTLAIMPWFATLIFVYKVCMSDLLIDLTRRLSRLSQSVASMFPAAILIMVPMQTYSPFFWWQDLIIYFILLILLSIAIRFVTQLCKLLFSKTFEWKYIFHGSK